MREKKKEKDQVLSMHFSEPELVLWWRVNLKQTVCVLLTSPASSLVSHQSDKDAIEMQIKLQIYELCLRKTEQTGCICT